MPLSDKQKQILAFPFTEKYQALICDGAIRSGKTSVMTIAFVDWAMRDFNGACFALCGKTVGTVIKNVITPYLSLSYPRHKYDITFTRSDSKLLIRRGSVSNTFYIYGGKDESSYMLIQGVTLAGVFFDEVALCSRSFVEEAMARCLTYPNRRYFFSCNPDSPMHWFHREWILQPDKHRALHIHFLMRDNPALDEDTILQAEQDFSGIYYERKVLGKWVIADGLVYPMFDRAEHVVPSVPRNYEKYWIGIDYGIQNATAMGLWGLCGGVFYCIREFYHSGRDSSCQKTDEEYYADLEHLADGLPVDAVIIDPSAASFIELIRRKRRFRVRRADNAVIEGISACCSALRQGIVKFNDCCERTILEFGLYQWDDSSHEDKPRKVHDHCMDGIFRYPVYTLRWTRHRRNYFGEKG